MPRSVRPRGVDHELPRLALATSSTGPEPSVACLAMLAGLTQWRWRVQHFRTRACPTATEAVGQPMGRMSLPPQSGDTVASHILGS